MDTCTILMPLAKAQEAYQALERAAGGPKGIVLTGSPDDWSSIEVTRKKLFGTSSIHFSTQQSPEDLENMRKGLLFVFSSVPTPHQTIRRALIGRISAFQSTISVSTKRMAGMEDLLFAVAKAVEGIIFWAGTELLDAKGRLILDLKGNSRVDAFEGAKAGEAIPEPFADTDKARKTKTEAFLKQRKIPYNHYLQMSVPSDSALLRTPAEIADRALALAVVAMNAEDPNPEFAKGIIRQLGTEACFSPLEQQFLMQPQPDEQQRINSLWRYEALWVLLWAIGRIDTLAFPDKICDVAAAVAIIRQAGTREAFQAQAQPRDREEILDAADMALRLHWAVVAARIKGQAPPEGMQPGVVVERHHALNWIVGCGGPEWDDIRTNT